MENNKYLLTMMVAKRAKELEKGAKPLVETKYRKPMLIALEEIKAGKVFIKEKKESLKSEDVFKEEEDSVKMT
jgi:DNA-directed RNA polymerase omega subunit